MDILRIVLRWSGFTGAPGYSSFHFTTDGGFWDGGVLGDAAQQAADDASQRVLNAIVMLGSALPPSVSLAIEPEAEILNSDTGEILGFLEIAGGSATGSATSDAYAGPVGAVANWRTNDYRFGRRIRGRTFLVPLASEAYEADGTLTSSAREDIQGFAGEIVNGSGSAEFGVWSRPRGGTGGVFATVHSYNVPDLAAVLRSRRD